MVTIEELLSGELDAVTSASRAFQEDTLELVRHAPEGLTAYDLLLAQLDEEEE
ncbi:hypothetical protein [Streptococcus ovuberis]|uniref:Uncharacterized protein n=1 Tax=Streptococcus ovuberis TaxID=1936207 RepID=A0A7X6MXT5_9STRE|nr:hypothetical protein [Streptococcus ovuberis]NKZ19346.1 hypothetical protein [Streptococcus ovuberis]